MSEPSEASQERTQYRSPRWMRIALIVSVALNMLVIGFAAGAAWKFRHHGWRHTAAIDRFIDAQPEAMRSDIRSQWQKARQTRRELRQRMRVQRLRVRDSLTRDPFDRPAYEHARSQALKTLSQMRASRLDALANIAERLPAAQRRAFVDMLERRWHQRRHWRRGGPPD